MSYKNQPHYADFIKALPQPDIAFPGAEAFMITGSRGQVVFFDLPAGASVPPHSHGAQWGIVVEGELELTIGGETAIYQKGDTYYVPEGVEHSATTKTHCRAIDVFADPDRYQERP